MSDPFKDKPIPRGALIGAAVLVGVSILTAGVARHTGLGTVETQLEEAVNSRSFHFEDRADGAVLVRNAGDGRLLQVMEPGTNGFARSVLMGFNRERRLKEIGPEPAFRITYWASGEYTLEDTATGRRVVLNAFGPDNAQAFARLLAAAPARLADAALTKETATP